jgi:hypothetical protein
MKRKISGLAPGAADQLLRYEWPGNVRELENAMERAVALARGNRVELEDLPEEIRHAFPMPVATRGTVRPLDEVEKDYILAALEVNGGNQTHTAAQLRIGAATLYRKLKSYGLIAPNARRANTPLMGRRSTARRPATSRLIQVFTAGRLRAARRDHRRGPTPTQRHARTLARRKRLRAPDASGAIHPRPCTEGSVHPGWPSRRPRADVGEIAEAPSRPATRTDAGAGSWMPRRQTVLAKMRKEPGATAGPARDRRQIEEGAASAQIGAGRIEMGEQRRVACEQRLSHR